MHRPGRNPLFHAAAVTTGIAGILHLILLSPPYVLGTNIQGETFFIVAAQIFWTLPMIKRWGKMWYYIGIAVPSGDTSNYFSCFLLGKDFI
jgi:hypothetical protein